MTAHSNPTSTKNVVNALFNWTLANKAEGVSVMNGLGSQILFLSYYSRFTGSSANDDHISTLVSEAFEDINSVSHNYADGLPGFLFVYQHLINESFFSPDDDTMKLLEDLDGKIVGELDTMTKFENYDSLYGIVGLGIYYLERYRFTGDHTYLIRVVNALDKLALRRNDIVTWIFRTAGEFQNCVNLGFIHGIPSLISFLALARQCGVRQKLLDDLHVIVTSTLSFCRSQLGDVKSRRNPDAFFPESFDLISSSPSYRGRFAFCYGDVGSAYALYRTAVAMGTSDVAKMAVDILKHAASKDARAAEIDEGCICHGSCGNLLVFNLMYRHTGDAAFLNAIHYWRDYTVKLYHTHGISGFDYSDYDAPSKTYFKRTSAGLLEGYAGIGLTLLSTIDPTFPSWSRSLLL